MMKRLVLHIYDFLSARKGLAVALWMLVLGLSLWSARRLDFQEDISAFLPQEEREQLLSGEGQERMAVFFQGGTLQERVDALYAFESYWNDACPEIPVSAQADEGEALEVFRFLSGNWPYFLTEGDYARMDSLLALPDYYTRQLEQVKMALYGGNSLQTRYFRSDPLNLYAPVLERLRASMPENRLEDGCLFTPDGETGILFFHSPYGGSESGRNAALVAQLTQVKAQTAADFPQLRIFSTGGPEVAAENARRIKKDSLLALVLAALLIATILWFSYKRLADVLWILISIATGAVIALGLIACFKSSVSIIVLGIGCTIIGIAVNYPLHYVDHLKYQPDRRKALADQVHPLLVGNITTVGAFLSMLLLKAEALHDFGFIGAMMLVGTILFVLVFLPLFVPAAKGERNAVKLDVDRYFKAARPATRRSVLMAFLVLTVLLAFWGRRVGFDANLHHINYMTADQEEGFAILEGLRSPAPMPGFDQASQEAAIARWNGFRARHPELSGRLQETGLALGFTPQAFQPFYDALEQEWTVQERSYFRPVDFAPETGAAQLLVQHLSEDFDTLGLLCSLIVFLFLWLSFGSLELSLLSFLPLAVSWIWIQGIMGLTGLQFNIVNVILASFIFGQGDDYTVFFTEGLLYERATGKKILHSYKNAVMLSGLIMFIGIGALVVARHPAMRSLGLVTVIGMMTVVAMAYYLPPLVFRWLTTRKGAPRNAPLTLGGMLATAYLGLQMVLWMTLLSLLALVIPRGMFFQRLIRRVASWAIHLVPGCPYKLYNPYGEDFSKPAVYICNHQSHLDVLALIALQPRLIFMTNDWVWKFPLYGAVIRKAGYFPSSWGLAANSEHVKRMVAEGYSIVIFPEGTRSLDGSIGRFHRGAFLAARELGLDVLPLCLHGFTNALPKHQFYLRSAGLSLEIGQRIRVPADAYLAAFTRSMRSFYKDWYATVRRSRETAAYLAPQVRLHYLYKGPDAQAECRKVLRKAVCARIDALQGPALDIPEAGCGVEALLTALAHPAMQITARIADEEQYLTATRCAGIPANLHYVFGDSSLRSE